MALDVSFFDRSFESLNSADFDDGLLNAVVNHWHNCLMASDDRDSILNSLGVTIEFATKIRIGLSDRTLGLQIPGRRGKAGLVIRTRLLEFGILRESGHEEFRGCVVIPISKGDRVCSVFGRRLDRSQVELWASGLPGAIFEIGGSLEGGRAPRAQPAKVR